MIPAIRKTLVRLDGEAFKFFEKHRERWAFDKSDYIKSGPIQYFGHSENCDQPTRTLFLEKRI